MAALNSSGEAAAVHLPDVLRSIRGRWSRACRHSSQSRDIGVDAAKIGDFAVPLTRGGETRRRRLLCAMPGGVVRFDRATERLLEDGARLSEL